MPKITVFFLAGVCRVSKATYTGDSRTSLWRKEKDDKLTKDVAEKHSQPLKNFFAAAGIHSTVTPNLYASARVQCSTTRVSTTTFPLALSIDECIINLEKDKLASTSSNKKDIVSSQFHHLQYMTIYRYFLLQQQQPQLGKMEA